MAKDEFADRRRPVNAMNNRQGKKPSGTMVLATSLLMAALPLSARAYEMPYDPYPWCAVYSGGSEFGGSNCGFLTLEQCRATVSGVGGSCEPNQFYNPRRSSSQGHRRKPR
jgi:hypothetical protein